jgi:hypothetical protein
VAKLEARLARLVDMRADGEIDGPEFRKRADEARDHMRACKQQLAFLDQMEAQLDGQWIRQMFAAAKLLVSSERALSLEERRSVLLRAVRRVEVHAIKNPQNQGKDGRGRFLNVDKTAWQIQSVRFEMVQGAGSRNPQLAMDH